MFPEIIKVKQVDNMENICSRFIYRRDKNYCHSTNRLCNGQKHSHL